MTTFSRFLIFMIFFVPIAYVGVSYYEGDDGLEKIKNIYQEVTSSKETTEKVKINTSDCAYELEQKDLEIERLKNTIKRQNNR